MKRINWETFEAIINTIKGDRNDAALYGRNKSRELRGDNTFFTHELKIDGVLPEGYVVTAHVHGRRTQALCETYYEIVKIDDLTCKLEIVKEEIHTSKWFAGEESKRKAES